MDDLVKTLDISVAEQQADHTRFKVFGKSNLETSPLKKLINSKDLEEISVVAEVLPFRINSYVLDRLIDWTDYKNDPIYKLTIPNKKMLTDDQYKRVFVAKTQAKADLIKVVNQIRRELNPHPGGQLDQNIPIVNGVLQEGLQHKYDETVLFFPSAGQVCHSYCTFCFRWAQFVGDKELKIEAKQTSGLIEYLKKHKDVTDVLITGGDPLVMSTEKLERIILPLLADGLEHIKTIRIGSKALTFWPQRFVTDADAAQLLKLLERVVYSGKHLAFMAHFNHGRELEFELCTQAVSLLRSTGCEIRAQGPILANINDSATCWSDLWRLQISKGIIPYYMFIERDTGANNYFSLPLVKALEIYQRAIRNVSGLARTVRGPVMSTQLGKVELLGVTEYEQRYFTLRYLQHRRSELSYLPFRAKFKDTASWFSDLGPATSDDEKYFTL